MFFSPENPHCKRCRNEIFMTEVCFSFDAFILTVHGVLAKYLDIFMTGSVVSIRCVHARCKRSRNEIFMSERVFSIRYGHPHLKRSLNKIFVAGLSLLGLASFVGGKNPLVIQPPTEPATYAQYRKVKSIRYH